MFNCRVLMTNRVGLMVSIAAVLLIPIVLYAQNVLTTGRALVGDLELTRGGRAVVMTSNAGAPTDGTSGTEAGRAGPGSVLFDTTNKAVYTNVNTQASPTWDRLAVNPGAVITLTNVDLDTTDNSIAAHVCENQSVTATGVATTDNVLLTMTTNDLAVTFSIGSVVPTAADTLSFRVCNNSAAAADPGAVADFRIVRFTSP